MDLPAAADARTAETLSAEQLQRLVAQLEENMGQVVLGKADVVRWCLVALLAGEHVLLEDVPGVGKTLVGQGPGQERRRRLLPHAVHARPACPATSWAAASSTASKASSSFTAGRSSRNIVLADEINRAPPRTQSALLEAMSEGQVSVDGQTFTLPRPFLVIATQNPFEFEGTYSLPESQLDRFLLRISMGYPGRDDERRVLASHRHGEPVQELEPVIECEQVAALQEAVRGDRGRRLGQRLPAGHRRSARATADELHVGVSTRGALSLYRAAQALALIEGRHVRRARRRQAPGPARPLAPRHPQRLPPHRPARSRRSHHPPAGRANAGADVSSSQVQGPSCDLELELEPGT